MSGAIPVYQTTGPARTVVETIKGGQLVEARAAGKVGVAGADSVVVLGVATKDATPASTNQNGTDAVTGLAITNLSPVLSTLTVACEGFWNLKAAGAIAFGERVKAGAAGTGGAPVAGTAPAGTGAARPAANIPAETSRMGDGRNDD